MICQYNRGSGALFMCESKLYVYLLHIQREKAIIIEYILKYAYFQSVIYFASSHLNARNFLLSSDVILYSHSDYVW